MKKYFLILFSVGIILYLPSLFGPFLWDDEDFVYANQYVKDFRIDKFFTDSQTAGRGKISNYYRPIPQTVYATTHLVFGFNPFWYHLINVVTHIAAAFMIFIFFQKLLSDARFQFHKDQNLIPLLVSLIFLIHPIQTEAVSYISGLSDPLYVLFGFCSLYYFLKNRIWWSVCFFTLSILSKETGLVFLPLLILLFLLSYYPKLPKLTTISPKLWSYIGISLGYLWFHFSFINNLDILSAWGNNAYANSVVVRLSTFIQNLFLYFYIMIFPKDLFMERDYSITIQTSPLNLFTLAFLVVLTILILTLYKQRLSEKFKILIFCSLGFFITLVPYTGILLINGIFYEHFVYLPLVFFFAFFLILFEKYLKNKFIIYAIFFILIIFAGRNFIRQFDWNNSIRFYKQTLEHAPNSIRIRNGLGMAYAEMNDFENALQEYNKAIKISPNTPNLYHNIANIKASEGKIDEAEKYYLKALEVDPNFIYSAQSLVNIYQQTNQKEKLEALIKKYNGN